MFRNSLLLLLFDQREVSSFIVSYRNRLSSSTDCFKKMSECGQYDTSTSMGSLVTKERPSYVFFHINLS